MGPNFRTIYETTSESGEGKPFYVATIDPDGLPWRQRAGRISARAGNPLIGKPSSRGDFTAAPIAILEVADDDDTAKPGSSWHCLCLDLTRVIVYGRGIALVRLMRVIVQVEILLRPVAFLLAVNGCVRAGGDGRLAL
jgi:hypothetical protein